MVLAESDDGNDTRHHIEEECAEVAHQRHDYRTLWDFRCEIVAPKSEAVPEILRQALDHIIRLSAWPGEVEQNGDDPEDGGDDGQCPDRPVRRELFAVQHS